MNSRRQSGFTLIELLVGLTLLGLTVAIIALALNTGLIGADVTGKRSARLNQIRTAQGVLRRQLESARPVSWSDAARARVGFDGSENSVQFVAIEPPWPGSGGPHLVRIARTGDRVVMTRKIYAGEEKSFDFADPAGTTVLLTGVRGLSLGYFGKTNPREQASWHTSWRDRTTLPALVRIRVAFANTAGTAWPELIVAPVIGPQPR